MPSSLAGKSILINCRFVCKEILSLEAFINLHETDILFLTETWTNSRNCTDSVLSFNGNYVVYRCDRDDEDRGGGAAILIHKNLMCVLISTSSFSRFCQMVVVDLFISRSFTVLIDPHYVPHNPLLLLFRLLIHCWL